jgi:HAD superfamily hydrolase (TIGR01509 family)
MKLKLILFDFSGTLAYLSKPIDFKGFFDSLKNFGLEIETDEEIKAFATLFTDLLGWARDWLDFSEKIFVEYVEKPEREAVEKLARFLEKNVSFKLYDDVKEILDLPVQKAILSANARFIVESLGLDKFAKIFTPKETKFLKPDKRAFLASLKKLKVKPEETLMVGDEIERDLIPAKELGMEVVLIDRENKIENPPVKKINSLKELKNILIRN